MSTTYSPLRWGILGAGSIARKFSNDVKSLPDHQVVAVGSRDAEKGAAFAKPLGISHVHASYEALVADAEVDIIYVATPHNFHKEHCLLCLNAGKHVLCEKPFTLNAAEADTVIATAAAKGKFLMEGMWSRCFPAWVKVRELVREGAIGTPRLLLTDFGFRGGATGDDGKLSGINPEARLFNPALAGGALMDVGVYCVSLAQSLLGTPDAVAGLGTLGHTGVDENTGMLMRFPGGAVSVMSTSLQIGTTHTATLLGTAGKIEVHNPCWCPKTMTLYQNNKAPQNFDFPFEGGGFQFEAMHVAERLRGGHLQSDIVSWEDSRVVMQTLDSLRQQIGVLYPGE